MSDALKDLLDKPVILDPPPTDNLPAVVHSPFQKLTQSELVSLARAVAYDLKDLPDTLADFKLTEAEFAVIKADEWFHRIYEALVLEWRAATNTPERVKLQSAALIEDALPVLGARMKSKNEDLNKAVEAVKVVAKLAGLGERDTTGLGGEKISININLGGGDKITLEKDITPIEAKPVSSQVLAEPQRPGDSEAVPTK